MNTGTLLAPVIGCVVDSFLGELKRLAEVADDEEPGEDTPERGTFAVEETVGELGFLVEAPFVAASLAC